MRNLRVIAGLASLGLAALFAVAAAMPASAATTHPAYPYNVTMTWLTKASADTVPVDASSPGVFDQGAQTRLDQTPDCMATPAWIQVDTWTITSDADEALYESLRDGGTLAEVNGTPQDSTIVTSWHFTLPPLCDTTNYVPLAVAPTVTPPTCDADGYATILANATVKWLVDGAQVNAGLGGPIGPGTHAVTAHTIAGSLFVGGDRAMAFTVVVLPALTGDACATATPTPDDTPSETPSDTPSTSTSAPTPADTGSTDAPAPAATGATEASTTTLAEVDAPSAAVLADVATPGDSVLASTGAGHVGVLAALGALAIIAGAALLVPWRRIRKH